MDFRRVQLSASDYAEFSSFFLDRTLMKAFVVELSIFSQEIFVGRISSSMG